MTKQLREKLAKGQNCFGLYLSLTDPAVVEMAAETGYDFVRLDMEHTLYSMAELRELIRTANWAGIPVFVRVPSLALIPPIMDAGADGVIVPGVDCVETAQRAVAETKFAPIGQRGMALSQRSSGYGAIGREAYCAGANENTLLCIQIETRRGVEQIEQILSVPGIDMVSSGRNDLSQSYGCPGQSTAPEVLAAEEKILLTALAGGIIPVPLVGTPQRKKQLEKMGVHCFTIGRDYPLLRSSLQANRMKYYDEG